MRAANNKCNHFQSIPSLNRLERDTAIIKCTQCSTSSANTCNMALNHFTSTIKITFSPFQHRRLPQRWARTANVNKFVSRSHMIRSDAQGKFRILFRHGKLGKTITAVENETKENISKIFSLPFSLQRSFV